MSELILTHNLLQNKIIHYSVIKMLEYYFLITNILTLFYMGRAYDKPSLHSFCCHFDRDKANRLKTRWQFIFGSSGDLNKVSFLIYYEKTSKICILKNLVRNISFFQVIFMNSWSRGNHTWLWIGRSGFESRRKLFFFHSFFTFLSFWEAVENANTMPISKWGLPFL